MEGGWYKIIFQIEGLSSYFISQYILIVVIVVDFLGTVCELLASA